MTVIVGVAECGCVKAACLGSSMDGEDVRSFLESGLKIESREGPVSLPEGCDRCKAKEHEA